MVVISSRDSTCGECNQDLGRKAWITPDPGIGGDHAQLREVQTSAEIRSESTIPAGQNLEMAYQMVPGLEILSQFFTG